MPKHCQKFLLEREEQMYFHSGVDGSLFVPGWEQFHRNDEYCVDYYYEKGEKDPSVDVITVSDGKARKDSNSRVVSRRWKL
jgi:hypothetical protein